jgi:hypothetical protein
MADSSLNTFLARIKDVYSLGGNLKLSIHEIFKATEEA